MNNSKELLESVGCFVPCNHASRACIKCSRNLESYELEATICDHNFVCFGSNGWYPECKGINFEASIQLMVNKIEKAKAVPKMMEVEFEGNPMKVLNGWEEMQRILGNANI